MKVQFLDVGAAYLELKDELDAAYHRVMASGQYILGPEVEAFEREWAEYCGTKYCVGVGNGLQALELILRGYGIGPGAEVIVPANTYIATWLAVTAVGATIVPVEPNVSTMNIEPAKVCDAITSRTRAILAVHLYGLPAEMFELEDIAEGRELLLLADSAQAHGARAKFGAIANASAYSFYPGKNLGALGDGGAVTTSSTGLVESVRALRNYGSKVKYHNDVRGTNSRLDELQAALLRVKLKKLDEWNARRRAIALRYDGALDHQFACRPVEEGSVFHQYVIRVPNREGVQKLLAEKGIETLIHYPVPPHLQPAYKDLRYRRGDFPITEAIADTCLSLPIGPHMTEAQVDHVCKALQ